LGLQQTIEQWQLVFIISSVMLLVAGFLYIIFSSSELQKWNTPIEKKHIHEHQELNQT
jgi:Ca2+/Na+ antiporter